MAGGEFVPKTASFPTHLFTRGSDNFSNIFPTEFYNDLCTETRKKPLITSWQIVWIKHKKNAKRTTTKNKNTQIKKSGGRVCSILPSAVTDSGATQHIPVDASLLQTVFNCSLQVTEQLLCCFRLRLHQLQSCRHWQRTDVCLSAMQTTVQVLAPEQSCGVGCVYRESAGSGMWSGCCSGSSAAGWCSRLSHPPSA